MIRSSAIDFQRHPGHRQTPSRIRGHEEWIIQIQLVLTDNAKWDALESEILNATSATTTIPVESGVMDTLNSYNQFDIEKGKWEGFETKILNATLATTKSESNPCSWEIN